ncbi:hypothetical protein ACJIZ3_008968 [Penstemon smallii]|uniref:Uncharacterized protein n=1 Tax=Penstemon smallii TaxID=265156 RepID=A0ABD3TD38_9LAMI
MNQLLLYPMLIFNLINVRQKIDHIIRHEVVTKSLKHRPTLGDHKGNKFVQKVLNPSTFLHGRNPSIFEGFYVGP